MSWNLPYELVLGLRYTRSAKTSRSNGFISFISLVSMLGISLGVAALIIVLSVMNGFQKEVRDRMLGVVSHIEVLTRNDEALHDPQKLVSLIRQNPAVEGVSSFIATQGLLARGEDMKGVLIRGVDPTSEAQVSDLFSAQSKEALEHLQSGSFGVVLGYELARHLGVVVGDDVTLIAPGGQVSPVGVTPRLKQLKVVGLFDSGHYEYDANLAMLHIDDAAKVFRLQGATGLRIKLHDLHEARAVGFTLTRTLQEALQQRQISDDVQVVDWTRQNKTWFAAVQTEKTMMFIILTLIVAVAAFNLVSTLVMTVTDKRSDIAILRTLGSSPSSIMAVFMVQGAMVGVVGTLIGVALGLLIAFNVGAVVSAVETLFQTHFLPREIYLISRMPSDPQSQDILPITAIALSLSFVATLYPSWRASRVNPAQTLRYE